MIREISAARVTILLAEQNAEQARVSPTARMSWRPERIVRSGGAGRSCSEDLVVRRRLPRGDGARRLEENFPA